MFSAYTVGKALRVKLTLILLVYPHTALRALRSAKNPTRHQTPFETIRLAPAYISCKRVYIQAVFDKYYTDALYIYYVYDPEWDALEKHFTVKNSDGDGDL